MIRLVIDASALLSGVAGRPSSPPALLLAGMLTRKFVPAVCPNLLDEVRRGLGLAYFRDRVTPEGADHVLRFLTQRSAITARARAIVTSDKDLPDHPGLHPPALTPREACELLRLL